MTDLTGPFPSSNLSLTEAELSCIRDLFEVALDEDDETLIEHGQTPAVVDSLGRKVEQAWTLIQDARDFPTDREGKPLAWPDPYPARRGRSGAPWYIDAWNGIYDSREFALSESRDWTALEGSRTLAYGERPVDEAERELRALRKWEASPQTALEDLQVALENVARVIDAHGDVDTGQGQDEPHYSLETAVDYLHEAERKLEAEGEGGYGRTLPTFLSLTFDVTGFTEAEVDALTGEALVQGERSDEHPEAPVVEQSLTHKREG